MSSLLEGAGVGVAKATSGTTLRVLLIAAQELDHGIVRAALTRSPSPACEIDWAASFADAVPQVDVGRHDVYLVAMDLGPGGDGLEFIRRSRALGSTAPFILMTSRRDEELEAAAEEAGVDDLLVAVEGGDRLEHEIRRAVRRAGTISRLRAELRDARAGLDALTTPVAVLDGDGRIVAANTAWSTFEGDGALPGPGGGVGHGFEELCRRTQANGKGELGPKVAEVVENVRDSVVVEYTTNDAEAKRSFSLTASRADGDGPGRVALVHDENTERHRVAKALEQSEEQFRQAQKMEVIGHLAGGVAHDFNNLLTAIRGYAELLLAGFDRADPRRRDLREIRKAADRATSLTGRLLAFGRRQSLQPRILDLNDIVIDLSRMLRRLIGENVELVTRLEPDLGSVRIDPSQVEQVLMNLVVNARDAIEGSGELTIATRDVELDGDSLDAEVVPGSYVALSVTDNGCGMTAETRERLFEPFFTTKPEGQGTGLGLATVYGIVKEACGHLAIDSSPGEGTTFHVYLPRGEEPAESIADATMTGEFCRETGNETVLLVEDEESVRSLVREVLEVDGYQVLVAENGEEGLRASLEYEDEIDLLISDVIMPAMNGSELYRRLHPDRPEMKVLFVSGYTEDEIVRGRVEDGEVAFLQKPFSVAQITRRVRELLDD